MKFNSLSLVDQNIIPTSVVGLLAPEGINNIGSLFTHSDMSNQYTNAWTSSGPWTTFQGYAAYTDNSLIQWINMALGDGYGNSGRTDVLIGDSQRDYSRTVEWTNGNRVGHYRDSGWQGSNNSTWSGMGFRMMPLRNTTSLSVTVPVSAYATAGASAGYNTVCLFTLTPNSSKYSTTTVVNSLLLYQQSAANANYNTGAQNITIPANTTIIVCLSSGDLYGTTSRFVEGSFFYDLNNTCTASNGVICDMRMLTSLQNSRFNLPYNVAAAGNSVLAPLWTMTATNYGDR